ncbi:hypothetical protein [Adhaeribacter aquaticus]|nr:hypothetical protein [Adhaeribacter aquaticus]
MHAYPDINGAGAGLGLHEDPIKVYANAATAIETESAIRVNVSPIVSK